MASKSKVLLKATCFLVEIQHVFEDASVIELEKTLTVRRDSHGTWEPSSMVEDFVVLCQALNESFVKIN